MQRDATALDDQRPAQPGEACTCGRPAVTVYLGGDHGETGWCGQPVAAAGPCPWCGAAGHTSRCPAYRLRPASPTGDPS
jgi:hypothetical protein